MIRLSTTCLISCGQTSAMTGSPSAQHDAFVLVLAQVADHFDDAGHQLAQIGVMSLGVAHARKVEQLFGDLFAAKRFLLNHFEVAAHDVAFGGIASPASFEQSGKPAFERLAAHGDRGQRIVDLVGHAGRQKPDARQLLAANDLLGPLADLAIEIVANFLEARRSSRSWPRPARASHRRNRGGCDGRIFRRPLRASLAPAWPAAGRSTCGTVAPPPPAAAWPQPS